MHDREAFFTEATVRERKQALSAETVALCSPASTPALSNADRSNLQTGGVYFQGLLPVTTSFVSVDWEIESSLQLLH